MVLVGHTLTSTGMEVLMTDFNHLPLGPCLLLALRTKILQPGAILFPPQCKLASGRQSAPDLPGAVSQLDSLYMEPMLLYG